MAKVEWFRRKTWTEADREAFFDRLRRSRTSFHKAQYLSIQALELEEADTDAGREAAIELTDVLLRDYPEDSQLAMAYLTRARVFRSKSDVTSTVDAFRHALQAQRDHPGMHTGAHREIAWFVAVTPLPKLFTEAMSVLDEFGGHDAFPSMQYLVCGARALMLFALGDRPLAGRWAQQAIQAAEQTHSGFRYHPTIGLVTRCDEQIHARIKAIAAV